MSDQQPRRSGRGWARPLADVASPTLSEALRQAGFAATEVVTHWDEIVGPDLAARSAPVRISWPTRPGRGDRERTPEPGTLHVTVEAPFVIEVQYAIPTIIERVNGFFGWRCVGMVRIKQVPLRRPPARARARPPADEARMTAALSGIEDDALRGALERLGRAVGKA